MEVLAQWMHVVPNAMTEKSTGGRGDEGPVADVAVEAVAAAVLARHDRAAARRREALVEAVRPACFLDARRGGAERIRLVQAGAESVTTRPT